METSIKHKLTRSLLGSVLALLLLFSAGLKLPLIDKNTDAFFREAIVEAGIAYATCRVINASVSVIKESDLELGPMGVGISLAVGQVLDPIDDMTERLSDVLVTAITSLGVQKLAYEISVSVAPFLLAVLLLVLSLLVWFETERLNALQTLVARLAVLIAVARFCLPLAALANDFIHTRFFTHQIEAAKEELAVGSAELEKLKDWTLPEFDGVIGTIENNAAFLKQKSIEMKNALGVIVSNTGAIIENLLKLTFLYAGMFIIQVIALPLLVFWVLVKAATALFREGQPHSINSQKLPPLQRHS